MTKEDKELLKQVTSKIDYSFLKDILVKPLPDEYIEKEVPRSMPIQEVEDDVENLPESDTEKVKEPTNFKKGVILKMALGHVWKDSFGGDLDPAFIPKVGDTIAYPRRSAVPFDLFRDTELVNPYNVVSFIKA